MNQWAVSGVILLGFVMGLWHGWQIGVLRERHRWQQRERIRELRARHDSETDAKVIQMLTGMHVFTPPAAAEEPPHE